MAYVLTTSLDDDLLPMGFEKLVDVYISALSAELGVNVDTLKDEFDIVWLDYARVIVTGLWKNLSNERMAQYKNTVGPSMINRSFPHVKFIVERMHRVMFEQCPTMAERLSLPPPSSGD